ncbi:S-layer homology domain-containing protein [Planomicrobium sp. Y74]|uniref:S-layer homology domain-containing protein n=1 Tax=Planomicrobium sp. Y74 TaxID=2478977 RepID=UPI000EF474A5|nr:S-layer homology domain-containing protein [Planomicrobium sp. Y74]RLQ91347.1 S-layer homology domain-containing protein [Planomicrobium sp. Y74]
MFLSLLALSLGFTSLQAEASHDPTATPVSFEQSISGPSIPVNGGTKRYSITVPKDGLFVIEAEYVPFQFFEVRLIDENHNVILMPVANEVNDKNPYVQWFHKNVKQGKYIIEFKNNSLSSLTFNWKASLNKHTFETEPNNTKNTANTVLMGQTINASIEDRMFTDFYKIEAVRDGQLKLNLSFHRDYYLILRLFDSSGRLVKEFNTYSYQTPDAGLFISENVGVEKGIYYAQVSYFYGWSIKNDFYQFKPELKPISFHENEPNHTRPEATPIGLNETWTGELSRMGDTEDFYSLDLTKTGILKILLKNQSPNNLHYQLLDADGLYLESETYEPLVLSAGGTLTLSSNLAPGRYYIRLVGNNYPTSQRYEMTAFHDSNPVFTDVALGSMGFSEIHRMKTTKIVTGYPDGTFRPNQLIKRSHAALMIERAGVDLTPVRSATTFSDVPTSHPEHSSIQKLYRAGIIDGIGNGTFSPNNYLTREQMAKILVNAFDLTPAKEFKPTKFTDVPASHWAHSYVHTLGSRQITLGYSKGVFMPKDQLTRAQLAMFLTRATGE